MDTNGGNGCKREDRIDNRKEPVIVSIKEQTNNSKREVKEDKRKFIEKAYHYDISYFTKTSRIQQYK